MLGSRREGGLCASGRGVDYNPGGWRNYAKNVQLVNRE